MKSKVLKSFRVEIIYFSLLSLLCTIITVSAIAGGLALVYFIIQEPLVEITSTTMDTLPSIYNTLGKPNSMEGTRIVVEQPWDKKVIASFIAICFVLTTLIFIFYFLVFTKKFVFYLEDITNGIDEMSKGNFEHRIRRKQNNEFSSIAERLNEMADNIIELRSNEKRNEEDKNQLITSVAHDLRTPLTSIIGYLDLVSKNSNLSDETRMKYIDIAYEKSKRLEKLIDDLFSYTNYTFGQEKLECSDMDMVKFIEQLVDEFYPSFMEHNLVYNFTHNVPSAVVYADGSLLVRAFSNLFDNAIKYGSDGKYIHINLEQLKDEVVISITNYGRLIPEEELSNIFKRFYRVESSRSTETGGAGIGLAIVKSIMDLHKGQIEVSSDLNGTVFRLTLKPMKGTEEVLYDRL